MSTTLDYLSSHVASDLGSIVVGEVETSGEEIAGRAAGLTARLVELGTRPGDRVALVTRDPTAFYASFVACLHGGLTAVVIDPQAAPGEIARMLEVARPRAIVVDKEITAGLVGSLAGIGPELRVLVGGMSRKKPQGLGRLFSKSRSADDQQEGVWLDEIAPLSLNLDLASVSQEIPAYVMFTSGTTSQPKGVVISRRALFAHIATLSRILDYGPEATHLNYLPLHHTDGLVHGPAAALLTGMRLIRPGPFSAQAAEALPELLHGQKVTHFLTVPTILAMLHRLFKERRDLFAADSFQHLISTAGFLPETLWQDCEESFGVRVSNVYGLTETVSGSIYCGPSDSNYRRGTLGRPVDCDIRILDDQGAPVAEGENGNLHLSGPHLMEGYLDNPEATQAVLSDGWLDTGDIVRQQGDGLVEFVGRRKSMINRGGVSVYPEDLRSALESLNWAREVEVLGVPDPVFEEIIVVCAVLDPGKSEADLHAAGKALLAPERRPDRIVLMESLPRGPSGKVQRELLLEQVQGKPESEAEADSEDTVAEDVLNVAAEVFQIDRAKLTPQSTSEDVPNWDSYAQLELVMRVEQRFAVRLSPKELMQLRCLGDAVSFVKRRQ